MNAKKLFVLPAAFNDDDPLYIGYVGKEKEGTKVVSDNYSLENIVTVNTKCENCGELGFAPTFKHLLEKKDSILGKMIEEQGYADILCVTCAEKAVEKHTEK